MVRRGFGAKDLCTDNLLNADAHFISVVPVASGAAVRSQSYVCVADGVGSWKQFGIDPREFAHRLVYNVKKTIESHALGNPDVWSDNLSSMTNETRSEVTTPNALSVRDSDNVLLNGVTTASEPIHPLDAILEAWNATIAAKVVGSTTVCVATIDSSLNQLSYSNLGDGGLMIVRHIGSGTAGFMKERERDLPLQLKTGHFRIAYLSQQQLKSFNLPYQLGYSGSVQYGGAFENPLDADTASIPIFPGDIVLLATDGLFDNLDLNEIVAEIQNWESSWFLPGVEDVRSKHKDDTKPVQDLARKLVLKAREASINTKKDSPFAILAKENDILWSGGMPDDTTVVIMRVIN